MPVGTDDNLSVDSVHDSTDDHSDDSIDDSLIGKERDGESANMSHRKVGIPPIECMPRQVVLFRQMCDSDDVTISQFDEDCHSSSRIPFSSTESLSISPMASSISNSLDECLRMNEWMLSFAYALINQQHCAWSTKLSQFICILDSLTTIPSASEHMYISILCELIIFEIGRSSSNRSYSLVDNVAHSENRYLLGNILAISNYFLMYMENSCLLECVYEELLHSLVMVRAIHTSFECFSSESIEDRRKTLKTLKSCFRGNCWNIYLNSYNSKLNTSNSLQTSTSSNCTSSPLTDSSSDITLSISDLSIESLISQTVGNDNMAYSVKERPMICLNQFDLVSSAAASVQLSTRVCQVMTVIVNSFNKQEWTHSSLATFGDGLRCISSCLEVIEGLPSSSKSCEFLSRSCQHVTTKLLCHSLVMNNDACRNMNSLSRIKDSLDTVSVMCFTIFKTSFRLCLTSFAGDKLVSASASLIYTYLDVILTSVGSQRLNKDYSEPDFTLYNHLLEFVVYIGDQLRILEQSGLFDCQRDRNMDDNYSTFNINDNFDALPSVIENNISLHRTFKQCLQLLLGKSRNIYISAIRAALDELMESEVCIFALTTLSSVLVNESLHSYLYSYFIQQLNHDDIDKLFQLASFCESRLREKNLAMQILTSLVSINDSSSVVRSYVIKRSVVSKDLKLLPLFLNCIRIQPSKCEYVESIWMEALDELLSGCTENVRAVAAPSSPYYNVLALISHYLSTSQKITLLSRCLSCLLAIDDSVKSIESSAICVGLVISLMSYLLAYNKTIESPTWVVYGILEYLGRPCSGVSLTLSQWAVTTDSSVFPSIDLEDLFSQESSTGIDENDFISSLTHILYFPSEDKHSNCLSFCRDRCWNLLCHIKPNSALISYVLEGDTKSLLPTIVRVGVASNILKIMKQESAILSQVIVGQSLLGMLSSLVSERDENIDFSIRMNLGSYILYLLEVNETFKIDSDESSIESLVRIITHMILNIENIVLSIPLIQSSAETITSSESLEIDILQLLSLVRPMLESGIDGKNIISVLKGWDVAITHPLIKCLELATSEDACDGQSSLCHNVSNNSWSEVKSLMDVTDSQVPLNTLSKYLNVVHNSVLYLNLLIQSNIKSKGDEIKSKMFKIIETPMLPFLFNGLFQRTREAVVSIYNSLAPVKEFSLDSFIKRHRCVFTISLVRAFASSSYSRNEWSKFHCILDELFSYLGGILQSSMVSNSSDVSSKETNYTTWIPFIIYFCINKDVPSGVRKSAISLLCNALSSCVVCDTIESSQYLSSILKYFLEVIFIADDCYVNKLLGLFSDASKECWADQVNLDVLMSSLIILDQLICVKLTVIHFYRDVFETIIPQICKILCILFVIGRPIEFHRILHLAHSISVSCGFISDILELMIALLQTASDIDFRHETDSKLQCVHILSMYIENILRQIVKNDSDNDESIHAVQQILNQCESDRVGDVDPNSLCTFTETSSNFSNQHWYCCYTCNLQAVEGCCTTCIKVCHAGHDVSYAKKSRFFCDCGGNEPSPSRVPCKALVTRSAKPKPCVVSSTPVLKKSCSTKYQISDVEFVLPVLIRESISTFIKDLSSCVDCIFKLLYGSWELVLEKQNFYSGDEKCSLGPRLHVVGIVGKDELFLSRKSTSAKCFDVTPKLVCDGGEAIGVLLSNGIIKRSCISMSKSGFLAINEGERVVILDGRSLITEPSVSTPRAGSKGSSSKPSSFKIASKLSMQFEIIKVLFNVANEAYLVVCGVTECVVLTLKSSGVIIDLLHIDVGISNENIGSVLILDAVWVLGSQSRLMIVTNLFVKFYDLSKDNNSSYACFSCLPLIDESNGIGGEEIRSASIIGDEHGDTYVALLMESGNIYLELIPSKHVGETLSLTKMLQKPVVANGKTGVSIFFSVYMQMLFCCYSGDLCIASRIDWRTSSLTHVTIVADNNSESTAGLKSSVFFQWCESPRLPGILACLGASSDTLKCFRIVGDRADLQCITPVATCSLVGLAVSCGPVPWLVTLCEDGSLHCLEPSKSAMSSPLEPHRMKTMMPEAISPGNDDNSAKTALRDFLRRRPVDFFESVTSITVDIVFEGVDIHTSFGSDASSKAASKLSAQDEYLSSPRKDGFEITVRNSKSDFVMVGVRVALGLSSLRNLPTSIFVFGHTIQTKNKVGRWYDIPFEESHWTDDSFTLAFSGCEDANSNPVVDFIEVYGVPKDSIGWIKNDKKVSDLPKKSSPGKSSQKSASWIDNIAITVGSIVCHVVGSDKNCLSSVKEPYSASANLMIDLTSSWKSAQSDVGICNVAKSVAIALLPNGDAEYRYLRDNKRFLAIIRALCEADETWPLSIGLRFNVDDFASYTEYISRVGKKRPAILNTMFCQFPELSLVVVRLFWRLHRTSVSPFRDLNSVVRNVVRIVTSYALYIGQNRTSVNYLDSIRPVFVMLLKLFCNNDDIVGFVSASEFIKCLNLTELCENLAVGANCDNAHIDILEADDGNGGFIRLIPPGIPAYDETMLTNIAVHMSLERHDSLPFSVNFPLTSLENVINALFSHIVFITQTLSNIDGNVFPLLRIIYVMLQKIDAESSKAVVELLATDLSNLTTKIDGVVIRSRNTRSLLALGVLYCIHYIAGADGIAMQYSDKEPFSNSNDPVDSLNNDFSYASVNANSVEFFILAALQRNHLFVANLVTLLKSLTAIIVNPSFQFPDVAQSTEEINWNGSLLKNISTLSNGDLSPFFSDISLKHGMDDIYDDMPRLTIRSVVTLIHQILRFEKSCDNIIDKYVVSLVNDRDFVHSLCALISHIHSDYLSSPCKKLLLSLSSSKMMYYQLQDNFAFSVLHKNLMSLNISNNMSYDKLVELHNYLMEIGKLVIDRPEIWSMFCRQYPALLRVLLNAAFASALVEEQCIILLSSFIGMPVHGEKQYDGVSLFSVFLDELQVSLFIEMFLIYGNSLLIRTGVQRFILSMWYSKLENQLHIIRSLLSFLMKSSLRGPGCSQFFGVCGSIIHDLLACQSLEQTMSSMLNDLLKGILLGVSDILNMVNSHPNINSYQSIFSVVEADGYYLENEPCLLCSEFSEQRLFTQQKMESVKSEVKFTENCILLKLRRRMDIDGAIISLSEVRRSKMIKRVNIYYCDKIVPDIADLKNKWRVWRKIMSLPVKSGMSELVLDFPLPVSTNNVLIEYAELYQAAGAEKLICPRCTRHVTDKHGVCKNCRENAYQCRHCRNINYNNLDAFLCTECGFSKYCRIRVAFSARFSKSVTSIESDEDCALLVNMINSESKISYDKYQNLVNLRKPIGALVNLLRQTCTLDSDCASSVDVVIDMPSTNITRSAGLPVIVRKRGELSSSSGTSSATQTSHILPSKPNPFAVTLQNLYGKDIKESFLDYRESMLSLHELRKELRRYKASNRNFVSEIGVSHCLGCANIFLTSSLAILINCDGFSLPSAFVEALVPELLHGMKSMSASVRRSIRHLCCLFSRQNSKVTALICEKLFRKIRFCIENSSSVDLDCLRSDMQLLSDLCSIDDDYWESRFEVAVQTMFYAIDTGGIRRIAVCEHVILPCLGIVKTMCDTLSSTKSDNATSIVDVKDMKFPSVSFSGWPQSVSFLKFESDPLSESFKYDGEPTLKSSLCDWKKYVKLQTSPPWILQLLLSPFSDVIRESSSKLLRVLSTLHGDCGKEWMLDLLMESLKFSIVVGEAASCYFDLLEELLKDETGRVYVAVRGILHQLCSILRIETVKVFEMEKLSLACSSSQGYIMLRVVSILRVLADVSNISAIMKADTKVISVVIEVYVLTKSLVFQKTTLTEQCSDILLKLLKSWIECSENDQMRVITVCVDLITRHSLESIQCLLLERICDIVCPVVVEQDILVDLVKSTTQEEFFPGNLTKNPYLSAVIGPLMRDFKNRICVELEMPGLIEDDNAMELLVRNKIIKLDLPVRLVYDHVWLQNKHSVQRHTANNGNGTTEPMCVIYRLQGLDGEATEEIVDSLTDGESEDDVEDPEVEYRVSTVLVECGGLKVILDLLSASGIAGILEVSRWCLKILVVACKTEVNRKCLLSLDGRDRLIDCLGATMDAHAINLSNESSDVDRVEVASEQLLLCISSLVADIKSESQIIDAPSMGLDRTKSAFDESRLITFLGKLPSNSLRSNSRLRLAMSHVIPFLTCGLPKYINVLAEFFRPWINQCFLHRLSEASTSLSEDKVVLRTLTTDEEYFLDVFASICASIPNNDTGSSIRIYFFSENITSLVIDSLSRLIVPSSSVLCIADPCVCFALRILEGLCRNHYDSCKLFTENIVSYTNTADMGSSLLFSLVNLESVTSTPCIGALSEALLCTLTSDGGCSNVSSAIMNIREFINEEKKRLAAARREEMLKELGFSVTEGGKVIALATDGQWGEVEDEVGISCMVCQEGFVLRPNQVLGMYVYSKRETVSWPEFDGRNHFAYSTVTHANVIHFSCHDAAASADMTLKQPKREWEGATIRNSHTLCNNLLPILGPSTPLDSYRHQVDLYWNTATSKIGRCGRMSVQANALHDLGSLLRRFATTALFNEECHGGGRESNIQLLPHLLQMVLMLFDQDDGECRSRCRNMLTLFLSGDIDQSKYKDSISVLSHVLTLAFVLMPSEQWMATRQCILSLYVIPITQKKEQGNASEAYDDLAVVKASFMYFAIVDYFQDAIIRRASNSASVSIEDHCHLLSTFLSKHLDDVNHYCALFVTLYTEELVYYEDVAEWLDLLKIQL